MASRQPEVSAKTLEGSSQFRGTLLGDLPGNLDHVRVPRLLLDDGVHRLRLAASAGDSQPVSFEAHGAAVTPGGEFRDNAIARGAVLLTDCLHVNRIVSDKTAHDPREQRGIEAEFGPIVRMARRLFDWRQESAVDVVEEVVLVLIVVVSVVAVVAASVVAIAAIVVVVVVGASVVVVVVVVAIVV